MARLGLSDASLLVDQGRSAVDLPSCPNRFVVPLPAATSARASLAGGGRRPTIVRHHETTGPETWLSQFVSFHYVITY